MTKLANNFTLDQVLCISWRCYKRHLLKSIEKCKFSLIYQQIIAFILNHLETRPKQTTNDIKWKFVSLTTPCTYKSKEKFLPDERKIVSFSSYKLHGFWWTSQNLFINIRNCIKHVIRPHIMRRSENNLNGCDLI